MSKLSSLAKDSSRKFDLYDFHDENDRYITAFINGFEAAFKELREQALAKIEHLKQYEMMNERIFALKTYMDTMDEMLKEMK
jgi:hypothetical protein